MQTHCVRILKQTSLHTHHQACCMSRVKLVPLSMCALWPPSPHFPQTPAPCHSHAIRGKDDPTVAWKGSRNLCVQVAPRVCSPVLCWVQPSIPVDDFPPPFLPRVAPCLRLAPGAPCPGWVAVCSIDYRICSARFRSRHNCGKAALSPAVAPLGVSWFVVAVW